MATNTRLVSPPDFNRSVLPRYPTQPTYNPACQVNQRYKTVPKYPFQNAPNITSLAEDHVKFNGTDTIRYRAETDGPASLKHLYDGPHDYPVQQRMTPAGTMYDMDFGEFGYGGKREIYHYKVYPFTHRHVCELNGYVGYTLPYPNVREWTKYKPAQP